MPQNDIKKFLPPRLAQSRGRNLNALIKTVNDQSEKIETLIQACIDQLFLQTASGRYLIQLGEQDGFVMPTNSGLDIRSYKVLVPIMVSNPKQVRSTFQELIEAFYQPDRTRPTIKSGVAGPYAFTSGDDISIETENGVLNFSITADQVSDLNDVSAAEIAAVINTSQNIIFADQVSDRTTNLNYLRLSSTSSGTSAFIRVAGGKLQNILRFPEVIETENSTGTTWNLTKSSIYDDEIKFTWDGSGPNPKIYLAKKDDVITIRGLVDGAEEFSLLNGSYTAVDVGYDYFVVRNAQFAVISAVVSQNLDSNIVFTKSKKISIYDNDEFALTSETSTNTITLTVPAVPPLARRFLEGSTHLHGNINSVMDFTRNSIQLDLPEGTEKPKGVNNFLLSNSVFRINFRKLYYKTVTVNDNVSQPIYTLDPSNEESDVLPYTTGVAMDTDPFFGNVDSDEILVNFPFRHGFSPAWGITFSGSTGAENISSGDLNTEHGVYKTPTTDQVVIRIRSGTGFKKFDGFDFGPCDVYQHPSQQSNGADYYLQFANQAAAQAAGIIIGSKFKFDPGTGTDMNGYLANLLKYRFLTAVELIGNRIDFKAGLSVGSNGLIISGVSGKRAGYFGGNAVQHYLDKTSATNQFRIFNNLKATFLDYTPSVNPEYVGSFLYDPTGVKTTVNVSKYLVKLTQNLLRGANVSALLVDSTAIEDGSEFPQSGQLVLDYGTDQFEGPIRYYAVIKNPGSNQILIDPSYRFQKSHRIGASVQKINAAQPFKPDTSGKAFPAYITGTNNARDTLFALAELLVAAGVFVESEIILPDIRYQDPGVQIFD